MMGAYELVFWIGVAGIAAFIWAICKPERKSKYDNEEQQ